MPLSKNRWDETMASTRSTRRRCGLSMTDRPRRLLQSLPQPEPDINAPPQASSDEEDEEDEEDEADEETWKELPEQSADDGKLPISTSEHHLRESSLEDQVDGYAGIRRRKRQSTASDSSTDSWAEMPGRGDIKPTSFGPSKEATESQWDLPSRSQTHTLLSSNRPIRAHSGSEADEDGHSITRGRTARNLKARDGAGRYGRGGIGGSDGQMSATNVSGKQRAAAGQGATSDDGDERRDDVMEEFQSRQLKEQRLRQQRLSRTKFTVKSPDGSKKPVSASGKPQANGKMVRPNLRNERLPPESPGERPISGFVAPPSWSMTPSPKKPKKDATRFQAVPDSGDDFLLALPASSTAFKRPLNDDTGSSPDKMTFKRPARSLRSRGAMAAKASTPEPPNGPPRGFVMHQIDDLESQDMGSAFLGASVGDSTANSLIDLMSSPSSDDSVCPLCKETVDRDLLQSFGNGTWMSLRTQEAFCRTHKRNSAQKTWKERGYPEIDWDELDARLNGHAQFLSRILEGGESHYGRILGEHISKGKERTLLKSQHIVAPGYYGPRGLRAVQEHVISKYSSALRRKAVTDRQVSARGYGHYVQAVLVPELVVRLIVEDMSVSPEQARQIMEESVKVGELLNEDIGDTVVDSGMEKESELEVF